MKRLYNTNNGTGSRMAATVLTLVATLLGSVSVWAYNYGSGTLMFDNSKTGWSGVCLAVGNSSNGNSYKLTKSSNSDIWTVSFGGWNGAEGFYFYEGNYEGDCSGTYMCWYNGKTESKRTQAWGDMYLDALYFKTSQESDYVAMNYSYKGFNEIQAWNIKYYISGDSDNWYNNDGINLNAIADLGFVSNLFFKGGWVKTWSNHGWNQGEVNIRYTLNSSSTTENYSVTKSPEVTGEQTWEYVEWNKDLINDANTNNPGHNTVTMEYYLDSYVSTKTYFRFSIAGFDADDYSFGTVAKSNTPIPVTYDFNSYGWEHAYLTLSGDDEITFSDGTKSQQDVEVVNDEGSIGLILTPSRKGTYKSTLTLKGNYSGKDYIKKVTITARVEPEQATTVLIGGANVYAGPEVELTGYLKSNGCDNTLLKRGFFFCESPCTPDESSLKAEIAGATTLNVKDTFTKKFSEAWDGTKFEKLKSNTTYKYKAYVYSEANSDYVLSTDIGTFTTPAPCRYDIKDTVYYTLDNTQEANACELRFQTLSAIAADMKKTHLDLEGDEIAAWWNSSNNMLTKPVVIEVVNSTYGDPDNSARDESLESLNTTSMSGYVPSPTKTNYGLIIRSKTAGVKPVFKGGLSLVKARNITLKGLMITRDYTSSSNHEFSAVELGYDDDATVNDVAPGTFVNADIAFVDCEIDASAFSCIHAAACGGLKFDQCVFDMKGAGTTDNDKNWGASVKLIGCKDVQFTRNSLKGSHATSLWLQHTQNMVIMNNVFWNDNLFTSNVAFVRPVVYTPNATHYNVENIGVYYNTFYLADHAAAAYNVDFLRFGGEAQTGNTSYYKADKIHFKWNNCYSYDDMISARNNDATAFQSVTLTTGNYDGNNFWSKGDASPNDASTTSLLSFGTTTKHINVEELVCQSSATDPDELVLKGSLLNIGAKPSTDISGLGVATDVNSDRFHDVIRSEAGGDWSYGAFQQATIAEIDTIVWVGGKSTAWDDRANWATTSGKKINCANTFSEDLHVIIPDAEGVKNIPYLIEWTSGSRGEYPDEYVAAGMGVGGNGYAQTSKFAKTMTIQEGGAIKGVENLFGDHTLRYEMADNRFTAIRSEWILVGGVIKPVKNGKVGDVTSGDFYIKDHLPHVYMQHFKLESSNIVPGVPFTSLDEKVDANTAFGIYIPDQYGEYKLPAEIFYSYISPDPSKVNDGTAPKTFKFEGRFANEEARPTYSITGKGLSDCVFVNNSYPANLNVAKLLADYSSMGLQAKVYNYKGKSWDDVDASSEEEYAVYVKPNNGFVLYAMTNTGDVKPEIEHYGNGSTNYLRSASASTMLKLQVANTVDNTSSTLSVKYEGASLPKAFSYNESTPEIYVPDGSDMYSTYGIYDLTKVIPLTVRNKKSSGSLTVRFALTRADGFESVILEDRLNGVNYDLLEDGAAYCSGIAPGDCAGRFFLNINYADDEPTAVEESEADSSNDAGNIDIYSVNSGSVVISSTENVMLEQVYITDMSGRTTVKALPDAHYNVISLDGLQGVYVIKAVGDNASRTEKVIVK